MSYSLTKEDLEKFTGTENWFQHWLLKSVTYTDGIKFLAREGDACWLLDVIVSAQTLKEVRGEEFQVWTLTVQDRKGLVVADDDDGNVIYRQEIEYTDFPLDEIKLYFVNNVIMLPSEY